MNNSAEQAATVLREIARDETIKNYLLDNPPLYHIIRNAADRFIGGESLAACLETATHVTGQGHAVTIDFMGESTRDEATARGATDEFLMVIDAIKHHSLASSISFDLSHLGLVVDQEMAFRNASLLANKANAAEVELMISMEGLDRVTAILAVHKRLCEKFDRVGITLQAYLPRTKTDLTEVLKRPGKIRLVKGAYQVDNGEAFPWGMETDTAYRVLLLKIMTSHHPVSIATHDEKLCDFADTDIKANAINRELVEFEMLHGAKPELLQKMRHKGYITREYLPYGREWYLYLCHRLAENPDNIFRAIADVGKRSNNIE